MGNKHRRTDSAPFSLFPFLSILACVIGTLVFLISGLAIVQALTRPDDELVARAKRFNELIRQARQIETQRVRLEQTIVEARRRETELADTWNRISELRTEAERLTTTNQPFEEERVLLRLLRDLRAERDRLIDRIDQLERRAAAVERPIATVVSGGSGRPEDMRPTYVEVDADGITIHDRDLPLEVSSREIASHPGVAAIFQRVSRDRSGIVVFLIRDTGVSTYYRARKVASAYNTRHGKVPLVGNGALDPGQFEAE